MFKVIGTDTYISEINKWPKTYREAIKKCYPKLKDNPYVGRALSYKFLREKKIQEKRIYYMTI